MSSSAATDLGARIATRTGDRRAAILEAAGRLFASRGFSATTVRDIADAVGLQSGSLYKYFASKEEIAGSLLSGYLDDLEESYAAALAGESDPRECFEAMVRSSFQVMARHRAAAELAQNDAKLLRTMPGLAQLTSRTDRIQREWLEVIARGRRNGAFREDLEPKFVYRFARDAMWFTVRWWQPDGSASIDQVADDFLTFVMDGFAARPRSRGSQV